MAVTRIYLIRHAEAEGNLYRRIHGWYDSLITGNGYRQIEALKNRFRDIEIHAVYSSDLFRTKTTASAVYQPKGLELNTCSALREINLGCWEDMTWAEAERIDPVQMRRFNTNDPDFSVEGGETFDQLRQRVSQAILDIAKAHPGQSVAVFSHGMAIRNVLAHFMGIPVPQTHEKVPHGDNTAVALVEVESGEVDVKYFNDNSHVPFELSTLSRQSWWKGKAAARDNHLWFRPLDMEKDGQFYYDCREEAWLNIHGSMLHFDGEGFLQDARAHAAFDKRSVMQAMLGDQPAGLLQLDMHRDADKGAGGIPFFYMMPQYRSKGLGVQLLGQAVSIYRPMGRKYLHLRCAPDNHVAQRFYKKNGFYKIGEDPGSRVPLDIMEKYIGYGE